MGLIKNIIALFSKTKEEDWDADIDSDDSYVRDEIDDDIDSDDSYVRDEIDDDIDSDD